MMRNFAHVILAAASLFALNANAADGFNADDWKHKQKTLLNTTAEGVELKQGATQLPLALRLHTGNFAFAEAKPDGSDLRVTAADGKTPLRFHIEKYDATNELAVVWVQQPKLAPLAKTDAVTLLWGNEKAAAVSDAKGSYDAAQNLVLHFSDNGPVQDSTVNRNNPQNLTIKSVAGPLADAAILDGSTTLVVPASPSLKLVTANGLTFTAWIKPVANATGTIFQQVEGGKGLALALKAGKLVAVANGKEIPSKATVLADTWQHVAMTLIGGKLTFYMEGAEAGTAEVSVADMGGDIQIGGGFRGELDEVTLAATSRSADYIKALHGSQQPDSLMIGAEEEEAAFLNRFRDNPRKLLQPDSMDTKALSEDGAMRNSTIFRLYKIGIQEMHHRFDTQTKNGVENKLSDAALNSIRAAMDAGLNSQIVLLTIAISGGPFLGLLGTVVGVMITFAAIAAAGDVNVNSIAPGIAAALVATVAGLAVAIPALFGYNWLAIKIKNVSADTQVFADEFLTKSAELYAA